jgi:hypothetical protein
VTPTGSFGDAEPNVTEGDLEMNKGYQCMLKNDGKTEDTNPNSKTMGILQEMANLYDRMGDHWRTISYRYVHLKTILLAAPPPTLNDVLDHRREDHNSL